MSRVTGRPVTTREFSRVNLRLPPDLYHQLVISADTSYRSLNSEIILRLQRSLEQSKKELANAQA